MADRVACILLAAGGSTRLGSAKQLIDVDGLPLVVRAARALVSLDVGPVGVVIGARSDAIAAALADERVERVYNSRWSAGIGTSLRAGVAWAASAGGLAALIALCDQPDVDVDHLRALIAARGDADAAVTEYAGSPGVPAVVAARLFDRLLALPNDRGAKAVLSDASLDVRRVRCEAAAVDLDTPADVQAWLRSREDSGESRSHGFSP